MHNGVVSERKPLVSVDHTERQDHPDEAVTLPGTKIIVVEGPDAGVEIVAHRSVVRVGKANDNDLVLGDRSVSRHHFEIRVRKDAARLVDLGSTNGTTVDGVRVVEVFLSAASLIRLGSTAIRISPLTEPIRVPLSPREQFGDLLGRSAAMREVFGILERIAPSEASVVLEGESGTGKELAAEAIHTHSARAEGPFVAVDCGAIPTALIESELFGHVRGAFTGAVQDKRGLFEEADGGTLFLDEIGELPLELQPKLLRALEKRQVRRVGSTSPQTIDVRVVAATNRDLLVEVNRGAFREDLYYRLAVVQVRLPPLRARAEDVPLLIEHFVRCFAPERDDAAPHLVATLGRKSFPGNVRELRNAVQRALALSTPDEFPTESAKVAQGRDYGRLVEMPFKEGARQLMEEYERAYLERALRVSGGSIAGAARIAGLSRRHTHTLVTRHGLRSDDCDDDSE